MKTEIHPIYYPKARITCACGHIYTVGDTKKEVRVEICARCHPFYTGRGKLIDLAGRVEKFRSRQEKAKTAKAKTVSLVKRKPVIKKRVVRIAEKTRTASSRSQKLPGAKRKKLGPK